jgi:hypothetical protein
MPPFGWKYSFFLEEAIEEVPEYVVPWEAFRAIAQDYNLEMQYRKPFASVWKEEKDDPILGPLSERMGVRERGRGTFKVSDDEMEAASKSSHLEPDRGTSDDRTNMIIVTQASTSPSASTRPDHRQPPLHSSLTIKASSNHLIIVPHATTARDKFPSI